jgi:hypothetical protein
MKSEVAVSLSIAGLALVLLSPQCARASMMEGMSASPSVSTQHAGMTEAMQMVPARAALTMSLDAKKAHDGHPIRAALAETVHLKNGTELPSGTALLGTVATDDMQLQGTSKLALRFTQAKLKNGKVIPIKATIVAVYPPEDENAEGYDVAPGDQDPNFWTSKTLQVDQLGALSGIDLHSKIASKNSGVFVSTRKDDVKLTQGSEIALAIAAQSNGSQAMNGMGRSK